MTSQLNDYLMTVGGVFIAAGLVAVVIVNVLAWFLFDRHERKQGCERQHE